MNKILLKTFMRINTFFIQSSKGKIGSQLGNQKILVMHTSGRKTAKEYLVPIAYFTMDNGYYVVGSNWGQEKNAAWYYNLKHQPDISIDVDGLHVKVHAREAVGEEYDRLWEKAVKHHDGYLHYKEMTSRHIPIIVFEKLTVINNT